MTSNITLNKLNKSNKFSFGPLTQSLLSDISVKINQQETRDIFIKNIVNPVLSDLNNKFYIYYVSIFFAFTLIIILLIILIILLSCKNKNIN
jgi:hypothetical protein